MPGKQPKAPRAAGVVRRRRQPAHASTSLAAVELQTAVPPNEVAELHWVIESDGGHWVVLAASPTALVEQTHLQRNLSDTHRRKLELVIGKIGRFLDPIIAVVARVNPIRFRPKDAAPLSFDEALDRMTTATAKFNPEKIKMEDLARSRTLPFLSKPL